MSPAELTAEQHETVRKLQAELRDLDLQADIAWAKYMHTKDDECFDEVQRLEGEMEMKGLISYIPKAGEHKIGKIRKLVAKIKGTEDEQCDGCDLGEFEVRLSALDGVNAWRDEYGLPPLERLPRGIPGDSHDCTLAKAFSLSVQELGGDAVGVEVSGGDDIELSWHDSEGMLHRAEPKLGSAGNNLIEGFDANEWVDLLADGALRRYAGLIADDGYEDGGLAKRLQQISDEAARRKDPILRFSVRVDPGILAYEYNSDAEGSACEVWLGDGAEPVSDQIQAFFLKREGNAAD